MHRKNFIQFAMSLPLAGSATRLQALQQYTSHLQPTATMPVMFLGHGSPMNAIEENEFVQGFRQAAAAFSKPAAILCVSAHWETRGTWITAMEHPRTIHDFGGFPEALYQVQYPAPGSPGLAAEAQALISTTKVELDTHQWGLDHGAWSVIKHLYPLADVPVVQMSIDYTQPPAYHATIARQLQALRQKGVLIVGSGNMVHNLRLAAFSRLHEQFAYDWAEEASTRMKQHLLQHDLQALIDFDKQGKAFDLAIPTPEHFLPLIYTMALRTPHDEVIIFNDKPVAGSLTMTSAMWHQAS